eukprot:TRINITY_DN450_c0_g1_i7.p2 TRINITY_DN450_c0_g1~~TRINITY_DN450_c0_g1_i7.p2  ORF type:complete len:123 (-),score=32.04 TRINITY_DN450_c0_g1_i7:1157-1525(-)
MKNIYSNKINIMFNILLEKEIINFCNNHFKPSDTSRLNLESIADEFFKIILGSQEKFLNKMEKIKQEVYDGRMQRILQGVLNQKFAKEKKFYKIEFMEKSQVSQVPPKLESPLSLKSLATKR